LDNVTDELFSFGCRIGHDGKMENDFVWAMLAGKRKKGV